MVSSKIMFLKKVSNLSVAERFSWEDSHPEAGKRSRDEKFWDDDV